jgi:hypothetical protein
MPLKTKKGGQNCSFTKESENKDFVFHSHNLTYKKCNRRGYKKKQMLDIENYQITNS